MITDRWETITQIVARTGETPEAVLDVLRAAVRDRQVQIKFEAGETWFRKEDRGES